MFLCYRSLWSIIRIIHWKRALSCWTQHYDTLTNPRNAWVLAPIPAHQVNICSHNPLQLFISLFLQLPFSLPFFVFTLLLSCFFWHTFLIEPPPVWPAAFHNLWTRSGSLNKQILPAGPALTFCMPRLLVFQLSVILGLVVKEPPTLAEAEAWLRLLAPGAKFCSASWIGSNKQMLH